MLPFCHFHTKEQHEPFLSSQKDNTNAFCHQKRTTRTLFVITKGQHECFLSSEKDNTNIEAIIIHDDTRRQDMGQLFILNFAGAKSLMFVIRLCVWVCLVCLQVYGV
jgi:hypothetical protein